MKNRHWIFLLTGIATLCLISLFFMERFQLKTARVEIYQNDTLLQTIPLATLTEATELVITGDHGETNIVLIAPDGVRMQSANCPDGLCVKQGMIQSNTVPIVCLPNQVILRLVDDTKTPDAITGYAADRRDVLCR